MSVDSQMHIQNYFGTS